MLTSTLVALAASLSAVSAQVYKGFNYGSTNSANAAMTETDYQDEFTAAQNLVGASGFTSARLYTMIQAGTTNTPTEAIQAAINTKTNLLLGLWGSGGQSGLDNELAALSSALSTFGTAFTDLIVGISVGSEDLYRISPTGIENMSGIGAGPDVISSYISQVKSAISSTAASGKLVGHVDTWTAWVNSSNDAVISASDFIGVDAYPYFQNTMANSIDDGYSLFFSAYQATVDVAGGKPVWVTETGWPVSGATENLAVPSTQNAQTYWDQVGCGRLFDQITTFWYTLYDAPASPSFGIVGSETSTTGLFDLSCSGVSSVSSSIPAASVSAAIAQAESGSAQAGSQPTGAKIGSGSEAQGESSSAGATAVPVQTSVAAQQASSKASSATPTASTNAVTSAPAVQPASGGEATSVPANEITASVVASALTTLITQTTVLPAASAASGSGCPSSLTGTFEYPHLIVPVDKDQPDQAAGSSYNGTISSTISSIFNFDIPTTDAGKTCTLVFLLPQASQLTTSAFSLSGSGGFDVAQLSSPATEQTSYNTVPSVASDLGGPSSVTPGNEYVIASGSCAAGSRIGYEVTATGSLDLNYFQDYNPSPIGFYITVC
ncbi:glucan endo-1,3-beta-D-glucosidase, partial [Lecanoromycetidae sp. Uapishka_2]